MATARKRNVSKLLRSNFIIGAGAAALGYSVMNLLMLSGSMAMLGCGIEYNDSSMAIQWHVLAMFLPSIFMGKLIKRFGAILLIFFGLLLQIISSLAAILLENDVFGFSVALMILGLAWNVLYVCGSYFAVSDATEDEKYLFQSANEILVGVFAMLGAFLPAFFIEQFGWLKTNEIFVFVFLVITLAFSLFVRLLSSRIRLAPDLHRKNHGSMP